MRLGVSEPVGQHGRRHVRPATDLQSLKGPSAVASDPLWYYGALTVSGFLPVSAREKP